MCLIIFQGHPSNFKVTRDNILKISTRIERFWTVIQFEFTNGFEMMHKAWRSIEEVPYCFSGSSIKFHGHAGGKLTIWIQLETTRPVAAIKSPRFALLFLIKTFKLVYIFPALWHIMDEIYVRHSYLNKFWGICNNVSAYNIARWQSLTHQL